MSKSGRCRYCSTSAGTCCASLVRCARGRPVGSNSPKITFSSRRPARAGWVLRERDVTGLPGGEDGGDDAPRPLGTLAADGKCTRPGEEVVEDVGVRRQPRAGGRRSQLERVGGIGREAQDDVFGSVDAELELLAAAKPQQTRACAGRRAPFRSAARTAFHPSAASRARTRPRRKSRCSGPGRHRPRRHRRGHGVRPRAGPPCSAHGGFPRLGSSSPRPASAVAGRRRRPAAPCATRTSSCTMWLCMTSFSAPTAS